MQDDDRILRDGVYDLGDLVVMHFEAEYITQVDPAQLAEFAARYPDYRIASPYQSHDLFLISGTPVELQTSQFTGSGLSHGTSMMIENCPKRLLLLGEDD